MTPIRPLVHPCRQTLSRLPPTCHLEPLLAGASTPPMAREARVSPKMSDEFPTVLQFLPSLPTTHISRGNHVHTASLCLLGTDGGFTMHYERRRATLSLTRPQYGTPCNVFSTTGRILSCQYCFGHDGGRCSPYPGCCPTFFLFESPACI